MAKSEFENNSYTYPVKVEKTNEKFILYFIDFGGVATEVDNEDEIVDAAQNFLALMIIDYKNMGRKLPKANLKLCDVIYIHVWLPYFIGKTSISYVKKTVTIPSWLDILAKERKINYSAALVRGIKEELNIFN